jgi:hypothetical protein
MPLPEETLFSRLQTDPVVSGLVDDRIYPVNQVSDATLPLLTYQRISTTPFPVLNGTTGLLAARIQVSAWGSSYGEAKTLADAVRTALDGQQNTTFENEIDRFDNEVDLNYVVLDFTVFNN